MDRAELQRLLADGASLAAIGRRVGLHESTVAYWVRKHGLQAAGRARYAAKGGLSRADLVPLVAEGLSIAEIAACLGCSKATVRHSLMRHGLRTSGGSKRGPAAAARAAGSKTVAMRCPRHGVVDFRLDGRGYYRCKLRSSAAVARRRKKVKATLVAEAGGVCCICGYARSMRALHLHHLEPSQKRHEINAKGVALSLPRLRLEAQKCCFYALIATPRWRTGWWSSRPRCCKGGLSGQPGPG